MNNTIVLMIFWIPVLIAIGTAIFQWLWNITMPEVFGVKEITFWQAFRIWILAGILFGAESFVKFSFGG